MLQNWKEKLLSTNFILAVIFVIGGLFVGFPQDEAGKVITNLVQVIAGIGIFRTFFKNAELNPVAWLQNSNTWNYLGQILLTLFPLFPVASLDSIRAIIEAALGGNWQGILSAVFGLATIIWNFIRKNPGALQVSK